MVNSCSLQRKKKTNSPSDTSLLCGSLQQEVGVVEARGSRCAGHHHHLPGKV